MLREKRMPEFKLFGKTIQISAIKAVSLADEAGCDIADEQPPLKKQACPAHQNSNKEEEDEEETNTPANTAVLDPEANSKYDDEEEHNQLSNNQEDNSPKKPTKILPCPRCKSKDTKFCYYNNYNVNQPRHFCKNCQRYWTAGGSMRNVPVGAGRRKTKCSAPTLIPDLARVNPGSICHLQPPKSNGMVLSFGGADAPLGESMTSVLNLVEKTMKNCDANSNCYSFPPAAYFNGSTPWPSSWCPPPPFYPLNAYWGMPWLLPQLSSSPSSTSSGSNTNSSALGKRSRDGTLLNHSNSDPANPDKSIWIPKTTRADDHEKAAKFPTWPAMGFKNDGFDTISRGEGFFKAFKSSGGQKIHSAEISQILLANPAAVSRSFCFQES